MNNIVDLTKKLKPHSLNKSLKTAETIRSQLKRGLYERYMEHEPFKTNFVSFATDYSSLFPEITARAIQNDNPRWIDFYGGAALELYIKNVSYEGCRQIEYRFDDEFLKEYTDNLANFCDEWGLNNCGCLKDVHYSVYDYVWIKRIDGDYKPVLREVPKVFSYIDFEVKLPNQTFEWDWFNSDTLAKFKKEIMSGIEKQIDEQLAVIAEEAFFEFGLATNRKASFEKHIDWLFQKIALRRSWKEIAAVEAVRSKEIADKDTLTFEAVRSAVNNLALILKLPIPKAISGRPKGSKSSSYLSHGIRGRH